MLNYYSIKRFFCSCDIQGDGDTSNGRDRIIFYSSFYWLLCICRSGTFWWRHSLLFCSKSCARLCSTYCRWHGFCNDDDGVDLQHLEKCRRKSINVESSNCFSEMKQTQVSRNQVQVNFLGFLPLLSSSPLSSSRISSGKLTSSSTPSTGDSSVAPSLLLSLVPPLS